MNNGLIILGSVVTVEGLYSHLPGLSESIIRVEVQTYGLRLS